MQMSTAFRSGATSVVAHVRVNQSRFTHLPLLSRLLLTCALLLATALGARAENGVGAWVAPADWPLIAIHSVLTPDGRVLTYGTDGNGQQTGFFIYDIWDPTAGGAGVGHVTLPNSTATDLFCSSQIVLPQSGTILISGGDNFVSGQTNNTGNNNSNVFTPATNNLARGNNMNRQRWYSSSTTLFNGETYIQGGNGGGDRPEIRGTDGVFRLLSGVNTNGMQATFPRNFLAPDGRIFGFDNEGTMYYVTTSGNGSISMQGPLPGVTDWTSGAAMFAPGKILQFGGQNTAAHVINITGGGAPVVTPTQSIAANRAWVGATVLADGRVLATGGSQSDNSSTGIIKYAEIWNPATGQWTRGPSQVHGRLYHNTALLLPDARVLVAGGGAPAPVTNLNAEIYTPPYLLAPNGSAMPRPNIVLAPSTIDVGQSFSVGFSNASNISRVTLVKTGSATHSVNMDQRFVELAFTSVGAMLDVVGPARAGDTPPGYYMLFVIDAQGTPSTARIVKVNVASNPNPPADVSPVMGGNGGSSFTLACNAGELLAGIHGTSAGTVVNQVGPRCLRMDQNGRWVGSPVNRGITGNASGASYTRTCPTDYAVSGFRGRASTVVDQLDIECRALTSQGKVTGLGQFAGTVGGTGGTPQGPYNCGTNNPAYALVGRSNSVIEGFGLLCRQASASQTNGPPSIVNPGNRVSTVGVPVDFTISASDPEGLPLTFSATGLPPPLSINPSSGRIAGTPTTLGNFNVSVVVTDSASNTASAAFTWSVNPVPFTLNPLPLSAPAVANSVVTFTASAANGSNVRYKWFFDDGTPETAYSSSPSIAHAFANPGVYYVTVTAIDDFSPAQMQTTTQMIHLPLTANRPANSGSIAYETRSGSNSRIWVVNQDNDSVSAFDAVTHAKLAEINVGSGPRSVAIAPNGRVWVANKFASTLSIIDADTLSVIQTVALPLASAPYGIAFSPTGGFAFLTLEASGRVLKLDSTNAAQLGSVSVGANPRHLSISGDGATLYVSRFITPPLPGESTATVQTSGGGEVVRVGASSMTVLGTTILQHSNLADTETQGSGVPNYLGATVISPDGQSAWVPSKQDNIRRGTLRNGFNLNFQSTVRAISSRVDLGTQQEDLASRLDLDNSSVASAIAYDRYGVYMFVALETSREVAVVDAHGRWQMFRVNVGRAPQGLVVSPDGLRLYVNNFMDRTLGVYDLSRLVQLGESNVPTIATLPSVGSEKLSAQVLQGKRLFYDAADTRLARDKYLSCATCHNDGNGDGRVWDLTGMGEGLRNTINLRGRAAAVGQGFLHWTANFDELQDFEGQIRSLSGGTGLMSDAQFNAGTRNQPLGDPKAGLSADLDALAAYAASLNTFASSPLRNSDGTLTADAVAGKQIFSNLNCAQCHNGTAFTDSGAANLHNVGTLKPSSGTRLGQPLTGIDTPTLRDVWATAPFLHDGSAANLGDAVRAHSGVSISDPDLAKLTAYLAQIGADEPPPPRPNDPPTLANPGAQNTNVGAVVDLELSASDPDGDALHFSASNLPPGLDINANTGHVTGAPTTGAVAGSPYNVTASVNDGDLSVSVNFTWTINNAPDTSAPSAPTGLAASASSGTQINLSWGASSDNVGVTAYHIERCQGAGCTTFAALTTVTGTAFSNTALTNGSSYSYRVRAADAAGNLSAYSGVATATTPDTTAPVAPSALTATATSSSQVNLSWGASTDNVGVTGYRLERCQGTGCATFSQIATPVSTSFSDSGLSPSTSYSYRVRASDAAGNLSGYSNTSTAATQATPPTLGLVAAYAFNEGTGATLTDFSGNANTGAITGATWTASGKNGAALQFDGTNDRVSIAASSSLNVTTGMTLEAWVFPSATQSGWRTIMQKETDAYVLNSSNGGGSGQPSGGGTIGGGFDYVASTAALAVNAWSHVALTYDGAMLRLYVNGTLVASAAKTGAIQTTSSPLWLAGNNPYGEYFQGRLDDARVYNRALSLAEIQTDMNTAVGGAPPPPDTQAPTVPGTLTATTASATQINLAWGASTDNLGVTGYQVERCQGAGCSSFTLVTPVTGTTYNNTGLTASTSYTYRVRATDAAGNLSGYGNVSTAVTSAVADTTAPTAPGSLTASAISPTQVNLGWTASTDNVAVTQYLVQRCQGTTCTNWAQVGTATSASYADSGLTASTAYRYRVRATDAAGNLSAFSNITTATTQAAPDTQAPTVTITTPTSGTTHSVTASPLNIAGTASDNVGVTQVTWLNDRGGTGTASGTTSWTVAGIILQTGANVLTVTARDAAGNSSIDTLTVTYNPPVPDTSAPTAPATLSATPSNGQVNLSWATSTDNVAVTGYAVERCQGGGCANFAQIATTTTTTYNNAGLTSNTSYSYRVRATDAAGNFSLYSPTSTAVTPAAAGPVAAYAFNEGTGTTLTDFSGNANTGAITGATWTASGKNGAALQFDGTNDRVSIAASSSLNVTTGMTLEAWVFPSATQSGWRTIMQKETDAYVLNSSNGGGSGQPSGGGTIGGGFDYVASTAALAVNAWSHVALTYDGAMLRLYVNGTLVASAAKTGAIQTTSSPLWLAGNNPYGEYFQGRLDDARVYNRALSLAEIQTDMNTPVAP